MRACNYGKIFGKFLRIQFTIGEPWLLHCNYGYKEALMEIQALRVNYSTKNKKREALESHISYLNRDNE
ncbi:hypothetical protein SETIT_3G314700v2 [Setaria italica]|uniref:Uncharacterized protein n=1 Tax=Setaria italica TaxID=4555 RepID=K3ZGF1_SETIT|nr:hypothetical protein SETIT_3G314700v2 [Setaria italica]